MLGACPQCSSSREPNHRFCPKCGFPLAEIEVATNDPLIGRTLGAGYVVLGLIGEGGMGRVYRAEQRALRRTVAVKIIHPHLVSEPTVAPRFLNEARATSQLNHPNVVSVIDFGKTDDELPFIVMEFLRGRPLEDVARDEGPLGFKRIADIVRQTLAALGEAHALGIIHRDLKPANIILDRTRSGRDFVKVLDFGLAKMLEGSGRDRHQTATGMVFGTPAYMSPEQASAGPVDSRSDLYSVGVVLFQLLTGRLPFEHESAAKMLFARITEEAPNPQTVSTRPLPPLFVDLATRAIAKSPEDRFQTADEFLLAVEAADRGSTAEMDRPTMPAPPPGAGCPTCGEPVPERQKFCGECGVRIPTPVPGPNSRFSPEPGTGAPPSSQTARRRRSTMLRLHAPAMEDDTGSLLTTRLAHVAGVCAVRLVCDPGFGKTTLLRKFLTAARAAGDLVVEAGPDPWWARPSMWTLRGIIEALLRAGQQKDTVSWTGASPEVCRGLQEVLGLPTDGRRLDPDEYGRVIAEALRWAVARAASGSLTGRVVLGVDDLDLIDGVSRNALGEVLGDPPDALLMMVATHGPKFRHGWDHRSEGRVLRGVPLQNAMEAIRGAGRSAAASVKGLSSPTVAPLYVEQVIRYLLEGGSDPPRAIADLLTSRIEALSPEARMVLQGMAALGDDVPVQDLQAVLPEQFEFERALAALACAGMIDRGASGFRWSHPLLREVTAASTPAAVRRELSGKACEIAELRELPLEVRAQQSYLAELEMEAMFLFEQVADRATQRGDDLGAIEALRKGLEAAKRDCACGSEDRPMETVLVFGRKLGDALLRSGQLAEADSLLREMLELAGPESPEGVHILRGLARVERAEARSGEAHPMVSDAPPAQTKAGA